MVWQCVIANRMSNLHTCDETSDTHFGMTCAAFQKMSFSGTPLLIPAGKCQATFCSVLQNSAEWP